MNELLNGTLDEAIEKLASLAADRRTRPQTYAEKVAAGDFLASLGDTVQNNPALSHALIGGAAGAGLGGLSTAYGNRGKEPGQKRSLMSSMLTGGLAGAGIGAGVGAARTGLAGLKGPGAESMGTDALKPGEYVDPVTQKRMGISPDVLKQHPDLHKRIRELTTPSLQTTVGAGLNSAWDKAKELAPTSSAVMPWVAGADAALHNPIASLNRIQPGQAGGSLGRSLLMDSFAGKDGGGKGSTPNPLHKAIAGDTAAGGVMPGGNEVSGYTPGTHHEVLDQRNPKNWLMKKWQALQGKAPGLLGQPNPKGMAGLLGERSGPTDGARVVARTTSAEPKDVKVTRGDPSEPGGRSEVIESHTGKPKTFEITEGEIAHRKGTAYNANELHKGRNLYKVPGTNMTYQGAGSYRNAILGRALGYSAPFLAEAGGRGVMQDLSNKDELQKLMAEHAKPIPEKK